MTVKTKIRLIAIIVTEIIVVNNNISNHCDNNKENEFLESLKARAAKSKASGAEQQRRDRVRLPYHSKKSKDTSDQNSQNSL